MILYKRFLIILLFTMSFSCLAQTHELDKRNGFKTMKFGDNMSNFRGLQEFSKSNDKDYIRTIWKTNDSELGYLFDDKIDYFQLFFTRDTKKLAYIQAVVLVHLPFTNTKVLDKFDDYRKSFSSVLGTHNDVIKDHIVGVVWYGKTVAMSLTMDAEKMDLDENGNPTGITSYSLSFYNSDYLNQKSVSEGF